MSLEAVSFSNGSMKVTGTQPRTQDPVDDVCLLRALFRQQKSQFPFVGTKPDLGTHGGDACFNVSEGLSAPAPAGRLPGCPIGQRGGQRQRAAPSALWQVDLPQEGAADKGGPWES